MDDMDKYQSMPMAGEHTNMKVFTGWVLLSQLFGLASVIIVAVWMGNFRGGFAWQSNPSLEFNYHPLFMVIGMVFLYGDCKYVTSINVRNYKLADQRVFF